MPKADFVHFAMCGESRAGAEKICVVIVIPLEDETILPKTLPLLSQIAE
ncbi:hypothetical protein X760_31350 [Mesorhizobium sp. LSHC422A00]|nr:hypothetical protein X760_31350 [Mesorhizobium sp. LSHC422A00]